MRAQNVSFRLESMYDRKSIGGRSGPPPGLVNAAILSIIYGYFAMGFDSDSQSCFASDDHDTKLSDKATMEDASKYENIGYAYDKGFKILFFCSLVEATVSMFARSIGKKTSDEHAEPVYRLAIFFYAMASLAEVVVWIYLLFIRFTHAGRVCSGDFLTERDPPAGYCPSQGRFILFVAILIATIALCSIFIIPIVVGRRRKQSKRSQQMSQIQMN